LQGMATFPYPDQPERPRDLWGFTGNKPNLSPRTLWDDANKTGAVTRGAWL